jgi:hypothetical protein
MAVLVLLLIINLFFTVHSKQKDILTSILSSILIFSFTLLLFNELLSFFKAINHFSILTFYLTSNISLALYNFKIKKSFIQDFFSNTKSKFNQLNKLHLFFLSIIGIIFILVFIQGIIYPPNNWDSMAYHLPRINEWIAHHSFENFQTHILRQLYQPCFSEYVMMQLQILQGKDLFNNSAQLFFHLFSSIAAIGIVREIGLSKKQQFYAFILTFLLPESLLQASSTQNDIFHGFFLMSTIFFTLKIVKDTHYQNFIFLGFSIGLAFLSKAIAFLYFPITGLFIGFYILFKTIQTKKSVYLINAMLTLIFIFLINFPHSYRNYEFSGDIRGTSIAESQDYINEEITFSNTISIAVKNIGLHLDPLFIGNLGNVIIEKFHLITGLDINKKGTNVFNGTFTCDPGWKNHEDTQPNFLHLILFISSLCILIWIFIKKKNTFKNKVQLYLAIHIILQFILFCALLSWEPWNTRLHIPLFYSMIPIIVIGFEFKKTSKIYVTISYMLIVHSFYIILTNYSREFIHIKNQNSEIGLNTTRYQKYFSNQPQLFSEYDKLTNHLKKNEIKNIGLIIHNDTWEYPLYAKLDQFQIQPIHLFVENYTNSVKALKTKPDCIISDTKNQKFILYKQQKFKNRFPKNKFIWLYLPINK